MPGRGRAAHPERRTALNFKLDIRDSGDLLARFGMVNVVRRGKGRMEGQVGWISAPFSLTFAPWPGRSASTSNQGSFEGRPGPGQTAERARPAVPAAPPSLDFRMCSAKALRFDFVRGDMLIDQGVASATTCR